MTELALVPVGGGQGGVSNRVGAARRLAAALGWFWVGLAVGGSYAGLSARVGFADTDGAGKPLQTEHFPALPV